MAENINFNEEKQNVVSSHMDFEWEPPCRDAFYSKDTSNLIINIRVNKETIDSGNMVFDFSCAGVVGEVLPIDFEPSFFEGSALISSLQETLSLKIYEGSELVVSAEVGKPDEFEILYSFGETITVDPLVTIHFQPAFYSGEEAAIVLDIRPGAEFAPQISQGSEANLTLSTDVRFSPLFANGENANVSVQDFPNITLPAIAHTGEALTVNVQQVAKIDVVFDSGESLVTSLETGQAQEFSAFVYEGSGVDAQLNLSSITFSVRAYEGAEVSADLFTVSATELQIEFGFGESATATGSFTVQIQDAVSYTGEALQSVGVQTAENFMSYEGAEASISLGVQVSFAQTFGTGESTAIVLDTRPSGPIGILGAYEGSLSNVTVVDQRSRTLSVNFSNSYVVQLDFDTSTNFDLTESPPRAYEPLRIDINDEPRADITHEGYYQKFSVDVAAAPRFTPNAVEGSSASFNPNRDLISLSFFEGSSATAQKYLDRVIKLCEGNFIFDGNNIGLELTSEYQDTCYADIAKTGESLTLDNVSVTAGVAHNYQTGEELIVSLLTDAPMLFRAYAGESLIVIRNFEPRFFTGEDVDIEVERISMTANEGASASVSVIMEREVEIVNQGCLENQFEPIDEFGDPIEELFNPVPVEEDYFFGEVKARCF